MGLGSRLNHKADKLPAMGAFSSSAEGAPCEWGAPSVFLGRLWALFWAVQPRGNAGVTRFLAPLQP